MSFVPTKVLNFVMQNTAPSAVWSGAGAWAGYPYQWTTTLAVTAQPHGSPDTPTPYFYDGNDVSVGDYILTAGQGRILKIVAITQQTASSVTCTVEDENRQNTFQDTTSGGDGGIPDGEGLLFAVKNGWPILHPLPDALAGALPPYFSADVIARFMNNRVNDSENTTTQLEMLTDVTVQNKANNDILSYDASSGKWVNRRQDTLVDGGNW